MTMMAKSAKDVNDIVDTMMKKIEHLEDRVESLESRTRNFEEQIDMLTMELKRISKADKNCNKVDNMKCKECDIIFKSVTVLKVHINKRHPRSLKCTNCERYVHAWWKLETHLLNEHDKIKEF
jgi:predicted RNase H-like nuclease (RuvC/YqgF family)